MAKTKAIENLIAYIDIYSYLLPVVFFVLFSRVGRPATLKLAGAYCILSFSINIWISMTTQKNVFLYEVVTLIECLLFASILYVITTSYLAKRLILLLGIAYTAFFFIYTLHFKSVQLIDSIPIGIETIFILSFCFYYLYEQLNANTSLFIYTKPVFWVVLGIILYLAGCFFIYLLAPYLSEAELNKYWVITNIFSILKNILFCIAIYINARPFKEMVQYDYELGSSLN